MTTLFISAATSSTHTDPVPTSIWFPRVCAALCDAEGNVIESFALTVRAGGRVIEASAARAYGITTKQCEQRGVAESHVARLICGLAHPKFPADLPGLASCASVVVCWNAEVIKAGMIRALSAMGEPSRAFVRPRLQFVDLESACTPFCKLPPDEDDETSGQYRAPTRSEACAAPGITASPVSSGAGQVVESHLAAERAVYAALSQRGAFETMGAAA